ncbi:aspartate/tyrosine/aromatic aminotransferase [soil metagenome]
MTASLFASVELAPRDPILGLNESFANDTRSTKVNLGVGVYFNDEGRIPVLRAVASAERTLVERAAPRGYLPMEGIAAYDKAVQQYLLGPDSKAIAEGRVVTAQALGGTGALKLGADFLRRLAPDAKVAISDPSWENHRALFEFAGFDVIQYAYYDARTGGLALDAMLTSLRSLDRGTIVVLHACCHNPTGVDLSMAQWQQVLDIVIERGLIPFLDIAYQGFGDSIDSDAAPVRLFVDSGIACFISSSFSKSFSFYGERVGALTIVDHSKDESARVLSQLKRVIRTNYSNPPTHGGSVVAAVLNDAALRAQWEEELAEMRVRIKQMRTALTKYLKAAGVTSDISYIEKQRGMFSYTGLTAAQVARLASEFGIYAVSSGRICVAALNTRNVEYVANAMATVLSSEPVAA